MTPTALATTLRSLREQRGLTQRQLAEQAGVNRATLQNIEQSRVFRPWRHIVDALADALGVEPDTLTTDVFDPARPKQPRFVEPPAPPVQVAPVPPARPSLLALAAAVQTYDPLAEIAIDHDGPAVAAWLTNGDLLYLWSRHSWAHYLRERGLDLTTDLPDIVNPFRREQTPEAKRALSAFIWS